MTYSKILLLLLALVLVSCTGSVIENIETSYAGARLTALRVEQAIVAGMAVRGWETQRRAPGRIFAVLNLRQHQAVVEIAFDENQYRINYVSSKNLGESKSGREIHRNYNKWVKHLDADIQQKLTAP